MQRFTSSAARGVPVVLLLPAVMAAAPATAEMPGAVRASLRIANGSGGFAGVLADGDEFGVEIDRRSVLRRWPGLRIQPEMAQDPSDHLGLARLRSRISTTGRNGTRADAAVGVSL